MKLLEIPYDTNVVSLLMNIVILMTLQVQFYAVAVLASRV